MLKILFECFWCSGVEAAEGQTYEDALIELGWIKDDTCRECEDRIFGHRRDLTRKCTVARPGDRVA